MSVWIARLFRLALLAGLAVFLFRPETFEPLLRPLTQNGAPAIYNGGDLLGLTLSHLRLTAAATAAAALLGAGMAIFVTRRAGADFLPLSRSVASIGQTFPPVAVLALAVPAIGFGEAPTFVALFLYGLLPIFESTMTGLIGVPPAAVEAARGMGMTPLQRLWRVELPLALPLIITGLRLSAVIGLGTATIGSTVGARTLGEVVIAGLLSDNLAFVVQGGAIVGALAVLLNDALSWIERKLDRRRPSGGARKGKAVRSTGAAEEG